MATKLLDGKATDRTRPAPARKLRSVWSSNQAVVLWGTMVGKKMVKVLTGFVLVGFVLARRM
jgi:hypothetical protein